MTAKSASTWQEELASECQKRRLSAPVYNIVSDRRGGRTAWSATVTVQSQNIAARYWYDGNFLNNSREDAAEVACRKIQNAANTEAGSSRSGWNRMAADDAPREEEKKEPVNEPLPEGAIARVGEEILD